MANKNAPFGFRAYRHLSGGTIRASDRYKIASGTAANIGYGDPVADTGSGDAITLAAADGQQVGIFAGCEYVDASGNKVFSKNWVTGTVTKNTVAAKAYVYDDPNIVFIAQMSLGFVEANVGLLADLVLTAPNSLGMSQAAVDSADLAGSAVKIIGLVNRPDNAYGNYAVVEVMLGNHALHERVAV